MAERTHSVVQGFWDHPPTSPTMACRYSEGGAQPHLPRTASRWVSLIGSEPAALSSVLAHPGDLLVLWSHACERAAWGQPLPPAGCCVVWGPCRTL